ncbi:ABC transporter substrate-binding protein [Bradyrhizobium icense]|nr:ABC transporter substrate-binding protein [Bradyrhizobium icense]
MKGSTRRRQMLRIAAACVLAVGVWGSGPASSQTQTEPVRIGALMSMTGALAEYGESILKGVQLAAEEINAGGGVLDGRRIEVVVGDDQTTPQPGVDAAQRLISVNRVSAIIGALASGVTIPVATSVTSVNKIPQISPASTAPAITTLKDDGFLFRTTPHDALQGVVLGDVAKEQGFSNVAVIYVNNDYGKGLAEAFAKRFEAIGGKVSASIAYEEKQASYRGEVQRAGRGKPDALMLIAYPGDGVPIVRQALEEGLFTKFVFSDGMKSTELITAIGAQHLEGMVGTAPEAVADSDAAVRFRKAFEAKHGALPPRPYIDTGYDAMYLLALAIENAKSTDGTAIRDALHAIANPPGEQVLPGEWKKARELLAAGNDVDYAGAAGSQNFDKSGDVPGTFGIWQIKGGKIETLRIVEPAA